MVTGWKQVGNNWYYLQSSGAMAANTWIGDYYVNGSGVWVQGYWVQSGNRWWYANPDGTYPKNGWKTIQSKQYYFDKDGWMVTGWLKIGSTWYYLNPSGERAYDQWVGTRKRSAAVISANTEKQLQVLPIVWEITSIRSMPMDTVQKKRTVTVMRPTARTENL